MPKPRTTVRAAALVLIALAWAGAGLIGWEAYLRSDRLQARASAETNALRLALRARDMAIYRETASAAPRPPAAVNTHYPRPELLRRASPAEKQALAEQWGALIIDCDMDGALRALYKPAAPAPVAALAAQAEQAKTLADLLTAEETAGALAVLQYVIGEQFNEAAPDPFRSERNSRGFHIAIPGDPRYLFKFIFEARVPGPGASIVVMPARFVEFGGLYRPLYFQDYLYPAYDVSEFWTNSLGLRDGEFAVPKPAGVVRIVCAGGSTTGEGPRNDLTYPKFLEAALRKQFNTDAIEVVNAGIDGAPIGATAGLFPALLALQPDLIVHYNFPNDAGNVMLAAQRDGPASTPLRARLFGLLCESRVLSRHARWILAAFMPGEPDYARVVARDCLPSLRTMHDAAKAAGAGFAICSVAYPKLAARPWAERANFAGSFGIQLPLRTEIEDYIAATNAFNAVARAYCEKEGAIYLPVAEGIDGGMDTFTDLCHLHVDGMRRKAELVAAGISDSVADKLRERGSPPGKLP